jgi:rare lipoprotein A
VTSFTVLLVDSGYDMDGDVDYRVRDDVKMMRNVLLVACMTMVTLSDAIADDIARLPSDPGETGIASWYGAKYRGRYTASGERFNPSDLTAAHPILPMGTLVEVSRPEQGRSVVVRINDRGPGGGRVLDMSEAAAKRLGMVALGTAQVTLQVIGAAK